MNQVFYDPFISIRRGNNEQPLVSLSEYKKIINGLVILSEIPHRQNKVQVMGNFGLETYQWYEIVDGFPTLDTESKIGTYKVDYVYGYVYFHPDVSGSILQFSFYGSGAVYIPASRIYSSFQSNGSGSYDIKETLEDIIQTSAHHFIFSTVQPDDVDGEDGDVWFVYQE